MHRPPAPQLAGSDALEEILGADLAAFENQLQVRELGGIGVGAAKGRAGLGAGDPGQGVDAELGHGVTRSVAAGEDDTPHAGGANDFAGHAADLPAELVSSGGDTGR